MDITKNAHAVSIIIFLPKKKNVLFVAMMKIRTTSLKIFLEMITLFQMWE